MKHELNKVRKVGLKFPKPILPEEETKIEILADIEITPARIVKNTGNGVNWDKDIPQEKKPTKVKRIT